MIETVHEDCATSILRCEKTMVAHGMQEDNVKVEGIPSLSKND